MNIRTKDRLTALFAAAALSIGWAGNAQAFEPWSNVNGYWVGSDGLTVIDDVVEKGMTISKYQNRAGDINWKKVYLDDISFAMVSMGYYDELDAYFDENMKSADQIGIKTGVCFYGSASAVEDAREEARYVLDIIKDYKVSYPIGYDIESPEIQELKLSRKQITEVINAFCDEIEAAGYRAVVYGSYEWLSRHMNIRQIPYDVWFNRSGLANNYYNRTIWRCTDRGEVSGVTGQVCLEFSFEDYDDTFEADGWREINGTEYYFSNYEMVKSRTVRIDGELYIFDKEGNSMLRDDYLQGYQR